jgi:prepilin-type N-terminal cleavage/methylation domain-containing protein
MKQESEPAIGQNWDRRPNLSGRHGFDEGFTMIELLTVLVILPLVVGAISVALISVISQQNTVSNKVSDSADAQLLSANFVSDVQSATQITTLATAPNSCAPSAGALVVSLQWIAQIGGNPTQVVVSYLYGEQAPSHINSLYRELCLGGSSMPTATSIVSHDVQAGLAALIAGSSCDPAALQCNPAQAVASKGWVATAGVTGVLLNVNAQAHGDTAYKYTLDGVPRTTNNVSRGIQPPGHPPLLILGDSPIDCQGNGNMTVNGITAINATTTPAVKAQGGTAFVDANGGIYTDTTTTTGATSGNVNLGPGTAVTDNTYTHDPYQGLLPPSATTPGVTVFAGNVSITSPVVFQDGIYIFENGLSLTGKGLIEGSSGPGSFPHVLFYVVGGSVDIEGQGSQTLYPLASPPSPAPGIVIWQAASDNSPLKLAGQGQSTTIEGTVYTPGSTVETVGTGALTANSVVADGISGCSGGGSINIVG